jgi:hypothetical protein
MKSVLESEDADWDQWEKAQDYASRIHLPVQWMPLPARVRLEPLRLFETNVRVFANPTSMHGSGPMRGFELVMGPDWG